jgi:putative copper export protein
MIADGLSTALGMSPVKALYVLSRVADYLGTAVFLGGLLFLTLLWPAGAEVRAARRLISTGWVLGLLGTLAAIGLEGAWAIQGTPADAIRPEVLGQVLDMQFGQVWVAKALLWVLAGVVLVDLLQRGAKGVRSLSFRLGTAAVGFGLLRIAGLTGHSQDAELRVVTQVADLVHLVGIVAWIGGLAMLLFGVLPRRSVDELAAVLPRYSTLAMVSMLTIVLAGLVLSWQVVGSWDALFGTGYGQLLLIKLGVLAVVLAIAQLSKTWVNRKLDFAVVLRGDASTVRPFVYSVAAETTLVIFVLLAAGFLITASPGR